MATNITEDWRDLFDLALFEPDRTRLRQSIKNARNAIRNRLDALMLDLPQRGQSENGSIVSERIALSDALTTLADLNRIVYPRKPGVARRDDGSAETAAGPR